MKNKYPSASFLLEQYGINALQIQAIKSYGITIQQNIAEIVNEFYDWLLLSPEFSAFFKDSQTLIHVKQKQTEYWEEFLNAEIDEIYIQRRREVGKAHARIGLPVQPYFSSMSFFLKKLTAPILQKNQISNQELITLQAITALSQLDVGVAIDAIFRQHAESFDRMSQGDYSTKNTPLSENDLFGIALSNMTTTLFNIEKTCEEVAEGHLNVSVKVKSPNDRLANAINKMIARLNDISDLAHTVSKGNYDLAIKPASTHDVLGNALNIMTKNLKALTREKEIELKKARALSTLSDTLRGVNDRQTFCHKLLQFTCKYFNALVGRIFLVEDNALHYIYGYADKNPVQGNTILLGEGLVGQAALEGQPIYLRNLPSDYIKVSSSIGEHSAKTLLVWPVQSENITRFVIEVGSFEDIAQEDDFLALCGEKVCATYDAVIANEKITALLEESVEKTKMLEDSNTALEEQTQALLNSEEILMEQQNELELSNHELIIKTNDLEEQKRVLLDMQAELEEKSLELETTSQYKSEFLANMSHELRTPLNSLLLLANMLAENRDGNLSGEQVESASVIHKSGQELLELINDILDLSKIEAGQMDVYNEDLEIKDIIDSVIKSLQPQADVKDLPIEATLAPGTPQKIVSDGKKIHHILRNLVSNAIKFTYQGQISISIKPLPEKYHTDNGIQFEDGGIAISVKDTGVGIAKDKQSLIFEAFKQADGTISRKFGGTGLGLSIVKQYTDLLGGKIHIQSKENEGSEFTLYLPTNTISPVNETKHSNPIDDFSNTTSLIDNNQTSDYLKTVNTITNRLEELAQLTEKDNVLLIAEDDEKFATFLMKLGENSGFKCIICNNGEEAYSLAEQIKPKAIILDVMLPDADGWSVFDRIKNSSSIRHIPIQFISAHHDLYNAKQKGAIGYLSKPANQTDLVNAVNRLKSISRQNTTNALIVSNDKKLIDIILGNLSNKSLNLDTSTLEKLNSELINSYECVIIDANNKPHSVIKSLIDHLSTRILQTPIILYSTIPIDNSLKTKLSNIPELAIRESNTIDSLIDNATLFLHIPIDNLTTSQKDTIRKIHDNMDIFHDKSILIVDDDMRNVFALSKVLRANNMDVFIAEDGRIAIETLNQNPNVDLILMDIMMPIMDGYEAIRQIKSTKAFSTIPIIALTAKTLPEDRHKSLLAGANDYLAKPIDTNRLLMTMRVWLQQQLVNS